MRQIHLAGILANSPSPQLTGAWRQPRSFRGYDWTRAEPWEHIARALERGCFDMVFFADGIGVKREDAVRFALQYPMNDPMPLIPIMGRATKRLGLAATVHTSHLPPYYVARQTATLDHLTEGRYGWNVVTGFGQNPNLGDIEVLGHDERYDRADEYMEVCYKLWESWEPDAVVADRSSGEFANPADVHRIDHRGRWFRCQGPLQVPRSPQGRPVIIQAGSSDRGTAFAARHAEVVFSLHNSIDGMKAQRSQLNEALRAGGRAPGDILILWGCLVIVGETEAEARAKQRAIYDLVRPEAGLALMSGHFNADLSRLPLHEPVQEIDVEGSRGLMRMVVEDFGEGITLAEAAQRYGLGLGPHFVGTPTQVADQMESMFEETEGDGFMLKTHILPGGFDEVVDLLVPELQRRGRLRRRYAGRNLREHLRESEVPR